MSVNSVLAPHLPLLRRFARALTGSQPSGDAYVAATLEAVIADPATIDDSVPPRVGLYKAFRRVWASAQLDRAGDSGETGIAAKASERLLTLAPESRQALLLTTMESFTVAEAAVIMARNSEAVRKLVDEARQEIERQTRADILIVEDEPLIALDLREIATRMGHNVVATVDTAAKAVEAAREHRPQLILADIQLADGSSGIDAVSHILSGMTVPVIFITAFPDRLLTGQRPEPTFLIVKPYHEHTVEAAISQALFFQSTERRQA